MCSRYVQITEPKVLAGLFGVVRPLPVLPPKMSMYNIAPPHRALVVRDNPKRELAVMRWGLVPPGATNVSIGQKMFNARAETVAQRPAYAGAFEQRRCIVPADGFYEWKESDGAKQAYYIKRVDGAPMAFAGLWEQKKTREGPLETFTIVTTTANAVVAPIHSRMPVILDEAGWRTWLEAEADREAVTRLLKPCESSAITAVRVGDHVNTLTNDDAECVRAMEG